MIALLISQLRAPIGLVVSFRLVNARVGDIDRLVGDADKVEGLSVSVPVQDRERRSRRCRDQTHEVDQLSVDLA